MAMFEVWVEGYRIIGQSSPAQLRGTYEASNFLEACKLAFGDDPEFNTVIGLSHCGCRLFDNEQDARKNSG